MISVRNLTKDFGSGPVLQNVSFDVNDGDSVVIIGGSGCGKSTLLRCINRLVIPESGEILIDGQNILDRKTDINALRQKMGMVYQHFNLFSHLNVLENIILAPMKVRGVNQTDAIAEAKKLLELVGMNGRGAAMPSALSGGQKQRVAIARTLAMHPDVILFDEPTSALDPTMVDEVESVIHKLVGEGMTSVLVTHEMSFARKVASRVLFLAERGIYEQGTAEEVFDHPAGLLTQRFLYRSRLHETELENKELDLYSLASEQKAFLQRFEHTSRHEYAISLFCDDLLYPLFRGNGRHADSANVRLLCSETGSHHALSITVRGVEADPLGPPYLDEINLKLLGGICRSLTSSPVQEGWEIQIQL